MRGICVDGKWRSCGEMSVARVLLPSTGGFGCEFFFSGRGGGK